MELSVTIVHTDVSAPGAMRRVPLGHLRAKRPQNLSGWVRAVQ